MVNAQRGQRKKPQFEFEYVTRTVSLLKQASQGDGIVAHVINDSGPPERTRVHVYQNTGAGATTATESGGVVVTPTWQWSLAFTIPNSGEYGVRIRATSECLIPKVAFERLQGDLCIPVVSYRPGDFAVFKLRPSRKRVW